MFCLAAPLSYRVDRGRHLAASTFGGVAALIMLAALTRAHETAPIPARSDADRPAPAGWAALRLLADVDISFSRNWCWQLRRWTLELGRPAPMLTSASPGRGGGDGAGAAASYRVIGNDRKFRSTDSDRVAQCRALSPDFPAGARGLYPLARGCRIRPALGMAPALMVGWIEGGAGFFLFSVLPGGAVELPGRSRPAPGVVDLRWV